MRTDDNTKRDVRIARAVGTSLLSKGGTVLMQFVALPIVARQLGPELFGIFASLSAIPAFFAASDLGIGPALGHKIAYGEANGDHAFQARYFKSAFIFMILTGAAIVGVGAPFLMVGKIDILFGEQFTSHHKILQQSSWVVLMIVALQMIVSVGSKARAGFQEIHLNNIFGAVGNLSTVFLLLAVVLFKPDLLLIILIVYGVGLIAQCGNLADLLSKRSYLLRSSKVSMWRDGLTLLGDSILFAIAIGLLGWQRELAKLLIAHTAGPVEVGHLAILLGLASMLGGLVIMITAPIWPAIADARARSDEIWLRALWKKLNRWSAIFAVVAGFAIALGGGTFVRVIYGDAYGMGEYYFWLLGAYFFTFVLGHIRFTWLMGHNNMKRLALISALEFGANASCLAILYWHLSIAVLLSVLVANHLIFSVCLQEIWVRRRFSPAS